MITKCSSIFCCLFITDVKAAVQHTVCMDTVILVLDGWKLLNKALFVGQDIGWKRFHNLVVEKTFLFSSLLHPEVDGRLFFYLVAPRR